MLRQYIKHNLGFNATETKGFLGIDGPDIVQTIFAISFSVPTQQGG